MASLPDGYIEVQEIVDPGLGHVLASRAPEAPVVAVLAWLSDDLDADVSELTGAGVQFTPIAGWSRRTAGGTARFRFASVLDDEGPLRVIVQHHDPHLTRRSVHAPNGVTRIHGVRRVGDQSIQSLDATDLNDAVALLEDVRPITSVVLDCTGAESCELLARSGWTLEGAVLATRADLGADLEVLWS